MAVMDQTFELASGEPILVEVFPPDGGPRRGARRVVPPAGVLRLRMCIEEDGTIRFFDAVRDQEITDRMRIEDC